MEAGLCQPTVVTEGSKYKMWFSHRGLSGYRSNRSSSYDIGYAESTDGVTWRRDDKLSGIKKSEDGWDSQMICYPCVIRYDDLKYMFYNGNNFGGSGIGLAKWLTGYE